MFLTGDVGQIILQFLDLLLPRPPGREVEDNRIRLLRQIPQAPSNPTSTFLQVVQLQLKTGDQVDRRMTRGWSHGKGLVFTVLAAWYGFAGGGFRLTSWAGWDWAWR